MKYFVLMIGVLFVFSGCTVQSTETDNINPDVVFLNPPNGSEFISGESVYLEAQATDNLQVKKVEFIVNDEIETEIFETPYHYYWNTVGLEGEFTIHAKAYDNAGNTDTSEAVFLTITSRFVFVEGGSFEMGDRFLEGNNDELPVHNISVNSFYMGKYEVTQRQYRNLIDSEPVYDYGTGDRFPAYNLSWIDAAEYCNKLSLLEGFDPCYDLENQSCNYSANGYRMPTEAEWEYAARGGIYNNDNHKFSGTSDFIDDFAWYENNSDSTSHETGLKQPNQLGIFDMSGNVWEMCNDNYQFNFYSSSPQNNPTGPVTGLGKSIRGGSWNSSKHNCRVSNRGFGNLETTHYQTGFRILRIVE